MATEKEAKDTGTYLYAVVSDLSDASFGPIGVSEGDVYAIPNESGKLVAVVSEVPTREELRPERRNLAAHQNVLRKVLDRSRVVLPVSFGTIADSPEGIRTLLKKYEGELSGQMKRVEGNVEMATRVFYKAEKPSVFDFFISKDADLAKARDRLISLGPAATRDAKIEMGQMFEQVLNVAREEYARAMESAVTPYCKEIKRNPVRSERDMARLACLVPKEKQPDLESAVAKAAEALPSEFAVEENGPFPPYDFIELHLTV